MIPRPHDHVTECDTSDDRKPAPDTARVRRCWRQELSFIASTRRSAGECRQPVDGGCVRRGRLRIGESSGARLAGQLGLSERERLLCEIVGQFGRNAGGLDKVPPMRDQVHDAPLQPLRRRWQLPPASSGFAPGPPGEWRRPATLTADPMVGPGRIGAEPIRPTRRHRALPSNSATNTRFIPTR